MWFKAQDVPSFLRVNDVSTELLGLVIQATNASEDLFKYHAKNDNLEKSMLQVF